MNNIKFFIYLSLSTIGGITAGYLFFQVWSKIQDKKYRKKLLIRWNQPAQFSYILCGGRVYYVVFEPHYLQTLLAKRDVWLNSSNPVETPNSTWITSEKEWFAKRYQCSVKQIYSLAELVVLFNLSNKEESSIALGFKSLMKVLQDKYENNNLLIRLKKQTN